MSEDTLKRQYLNAGAPTGDRATSPAITLWLRKWLRATANDTAVSWIADHNVRPVQDYIMLGPSICERMGWPKELGNVAVLAEYKDAKGRVIKYLSDVTPVLRRLAYERAPGEQMVSVAQEMADAQRLFIPSDYVVALCRRVAGSTLSKRRGRDNSG